ncbi:MAG: glycosyltransferase [Nitrospira sp.]|nr:glycosyltransferase [Nitrospira sp.]
MNLLVLASDVPHRRHGLGGVTAVNIVLYELLTGLLSCGAKLSLQIIFNKWRTVNALSPEETEELKNLESLGVRVLPAIYPHDYLNGRQVPGMVERVGKLARFLSGMVRVSDVYPVTRVRDEMAARLPQISPDAILTIWSPEGVAATYGLKGVTKVAYHGDIEFGPAEARMSDSDLFRTDLNAGSRSEGIWKRSVRYLYDRLWLAQFKQAHARLMCDLDVIGNVTATNIQYYREHGHRRSTYIRNTWSDPAEAGASPEFNPGGAQGPVKIIGHVGYLNRTGSTYGLKYLGELMPVLDEVMDGVPYEMHVIGGGEPVPAVRSLLQHPRIVRRGFIEDLDRELNSASVFLFLNNTGRHLAAYTRHVMAWAMSHCLVVHVNSVKTIPEIVHMENTLVGETLLEIATLIRRAATDAELNAAIRRGGRKTYEEQFKPQLVAVSLYKEIERAMATKQTRRKSISSVVV